MQTLLVRTLATAVLAVAAASGAGCSGDDDTASDPADGDTTAETTTADDDNDNDNDAGGDAGAGTDMFPEQLLVDFDEVASTTVAGGGSAAVGLICAGGGGDIIYAGVSGVADGAWEAAADGVAGTVQIPTGAPDAGVGFGAVQGTLDDVEYVVTFSGPGEATVTIDGCG